jgi:hypothetical protein
MILSTQLDETLYSPENLAAFKAEQERTLLEKDALERTKMYKEWLKVQKNINRKRALFIDNIINQITHDKTRAIIMHYVTTIPRNTLDYLFQSILSINLDSLDLNSHEESKSDREEEKDDELVPFLNKKAKISPNKVSSPQEEQFKNFLTFIEKLDNDKRIQFNLWLEHLVNGSGDNIQILLNSTIRAKIDFEKQRNFLRYYDEKQKKIFDKYLELKQVEILNNSSQPITRKQIERATNIFKKELQSWIRHTYPPLVSRAKQYLANKTDDRFKTKDDFLDQSDTPITALILAVSTKIKEIRENFKPATLTVFYFNSSQESLPNFYNEWLNKLCWEQQQSIFSAGIDSPLLSLIEKMRAQETLLENAETSTTENPLLDIENQQSTTLIVDKKHTTDNSALVSDVKKSDVAIDYLKTDLMSEHSSLELYTFNATNEEKELFARVVFANDWQKSELLKNFFGLTQNNNAESFKRAYTSFETVIESTINFFAKKTGKAEPLCDKLTSDQQSYFEEQLKNNPKLMEEFRKENPIAYWTILTLGWASYGSEFMYLGADFITRFESLSTLFLLIGVELSQTDQTSSLVINAGLTIFTAAANLTFNPNADARALMRKLLLHPNQNFVQALFWKEANASWKNRFLASMFLGMALSGTLVDLLPLNVYLKPNVSEQVYNSIYPLAAGSISISGIGYYFFYNWEGFIDGTDAGIAYWKKAWHDFTSNDPIKSAEARGVLTHMVLSGFERTVRMGFGPLIAGQGLGLSSETSYSLFALGAFCTAWTIPALRFAPLGKFYFPDLTAEQREKGIKGYEKLCRENYSTVALEHIKDSSIFLIASFSYVGSRLLAEGLAFSGNAKLMATLAIAAFIAYSIEKFFAPLVRLKTINRLAKDETPIATFAAVSTGIDQLSRGEGALYIMMSISAALFNTNSQGGRDALTLLLGIELFLALSNYLLQSRKVNNAHQTLGTDIAGTTIYRSFKTNVINPAANCITGTSTGLASLIAKVGSRTDAQRQFSVENNTIQLQDFISDTPYRTLE